MYARQLVISMKCSSNDATVQLTLDELLLSLFVTRLLIVVVTAFEAATITVGSSSVPLLPSLDATSFPRCF